MTRRYLDAGGRAPLLPQTREALLAALDEGWADPRRLHTEGRRARLLLDGARQSVAAALGVRTEEVHFTPGHTASLHSAVRAVARGRRRIGQQVVTSAVERAAVLHAADHLAPDARLTVGVDRSGRIDLEELADRLAGPGVALAAVQHANGEVGTVQPVAQVHEIAQRSGVPLLVDAGASVGHLAVPPSWDVLAADPGDWGGPPGIGVLAVRSRVRWSPDWPQEDDGLVPGAQDVPAALATAVSLEAVLADREAAAARRTELVRRVRERVAAQVPDVEVVGDPEDRLPHVVTFSCLYVDGEALVGELDRLGFAVGSGSACTSSTLEPSHVLAAMGVLTHGNVRLALPRDVTDEDVSRFLDVLPEAVARVRATLGTGGL